MALKIVLASSNAGKVKEIQALLADKNIEIVPQSALGIADVEENGETFHENALIKARHAARLSGLPAIADDSGLEVDALNGAPGVYSARYAGSKSSSDADNNRKLLSELQDIPASLRTARFRCVIVLLRDTDDPAPLVAEGSWEGSILDQGKGNCGFGYDPLFYVGERDCSAAELSGEEKNRLSHRGKALFSLLEQLDQI
ncbi:RdgB/HAM1 family non-canonical purine NTP pyrophosphatase [Candidatus Methylospira mobilis]|uniref:RdgB/HAM1 family non-canonical purine NTP pyrophosphatase n=1 Tax=Candidatus Methylospira mobilis TaxID=1808979 RepID=UPI0028E84A22|nr:RdgB/HAM1 family non-canonical purine NTP pyrophosphatase [Candidatus Methylospira mobilis]WNV04659.1 RdgB/HAM1 family non-canonical purine NTP pyrophosphatase [Candidatus Methylospira mobilis]